MSVLRSRSIGKGGLIAFMAEAGFLPEEWNVTPVGSTMHWMCGHVTDHGSVEHPVRCPVCFRDQLRLGWERGS
jgi:hypothetical protein